MNKNEKIFVLYENKLLGVINYKPSTEGNLYLPNFLNTNNLLSFLYELFSHEASLTKSGFKFLKAYYGLDEIAEMLLREDSKYPYDNKEEIIEWLKVKGEYAIEDENNDDDKEE